MKKKIIVAGGGHGGIAAAALLAKAGFPVCVYEKHEREAMGYDWKDTFDLNALAAAGIPLPPAEQYEKSTNITFVPPSGQTVIAQDINEEQLTVKMERRALYEHLIQYAEEAGVSFVFGCTVLSPLMAGDRVVGIRTDKGDEYAELVIDACGCESVIRSALPDCVGIQKHAGENEKFYVYRAIYNKQKEAFRQYKVYLIPNGRMGIGWVISDKDSSDLLIGEFEPFTVEEAQERVPFFRENNSVLGEELLRGGVIAEIPVRQPLSVMVADGYAAIGDSAFMTVPLIGSGIANSFRAAAILADVIINDETETYSAETLWQYQRRYFKTIGFAMARMGLIRCMLPKLTAEQVDYAFESGLITKENLSPDNPDASSESAVIKRALALVKDRSLTALIANLGKDIGKLAAVAANLPDEYARHRVLLWAEKYDKIFQDKKYE